MTRPGDFHPWRDDRHRQRFTWLAEFDDDAIYEFTIQLGATEASALMRDAAWANLTVEQLLKHHILNGLDFLDKPRRFHRQR
jgi:hypothetical protein